MWWFIKKLVHNKHLIFMITPLWLVFPSILSLCLQCDHEHSFSHEDACLMLPVCLSLIMLH